MKRFFLVLLVALASYSPLHAASPLTPSKVRLLEIRKDALPQSIAAEQLSVVVLMPLETCSTPAKNNRDIVTRWYCGAFASLPTSPELAAYQPFLLPDSVALADMLEASGDPAKRYVLLVDWAVDVNQHKTTSYFDINLATEEAVYDRQTKQWIWHALRRDDESTESRPDIPALNLEVQNFVVKNIVATVSNRGKQLALGATALAWTPTESVLNAPAEGRARLVLFNDYYRGRETETPTTFTLRKVPEPAQAAPAGNDDLRFSAGYQSFVAMDVSPGKYLLSWSGDKSGETISLAAGEVAYLRQTRGLFNSRGTSKVDKSDAADLLGKDFRSGVVPDTRPLARDASKFRFDTQN